jgi:GT2 family glycosyltransferase
VETVATSLEDEVARLRNELARIHASRLWRAGTAYWALQRWVHLRWSRWTGRDGVPGRMAAVRSGSAERAEPGRMDLGRAFLSGCAPAHDIVSFPGSEDGSRPHGSADLMRRLGARGHRVFFVASTLRAEGPIFTVHPVEGNLFKVSLRGVAADPRQDTMTPETAADLFPSLDALRREHGLAAAASFVQSPSWWPVAKRAWEEWAWPVVYDCSGDSPAASTTGELLCEQEKALIRGARCVCVSSRPYLEAVQKWNERAFLLPRRAGDDQSKRMSSEGVPTTGSAAPSTRDEDVAALLLLLRGAFPPISIAIVTCNDLDLSRRCLESVFSRTEWPNFEVIVVDNASTDGTSAYLADAQREFPTLHVVLNASDEGFAAASNVGLTRASGEILVLLSSETVVSRGWLSALVRHLRRDSWLGMVGPVSNVASDRVGLRVGYRNIAHMHSWAARFVREHDGQSFDMTTLGMPCMAFRREVFERVGPLDEPFRLASPEGDRYAQRVREAGYGIRCVRDAFVHRSRRGEERKSVGPDLVRAPGLEIRPLFEAADRAPATVIFPPTVGWSLPLFQRPHHLARAFAAAGYAVVFDCSNSRDDVGHLREIGPRLFLFRGRFDELYSLPRAIVWTFSYNVQAGLGFRGDARTVYDWIDDLSVFVGWDSGFIRSNHEQALARATLVTAVARPLHAEAVKVRPDALYLPNAVDYDHFAGVAAPTRDPKLAAARANGRPIAGYYGALAKWFDHDILEQTARLRPDWTFVLVGPNHEGGLSGARVLRCANVVWTGAREYQTLPAYASLFDVAMIPFRINPITTAASPLKLYEYFAAGKPVIATAMPECESFPEVRIVRSAVELSEALDAARADAADPAFVERLRALARQNSWQSRVSQVMGRLERPGGSLGGVNPARGGIRRGGAS